MSEAEPPHESPLPVRPRRPEDFDVLYAGTPPWDIGRPQPAYVEVAEAGGIRGRVLDVGCGTGEHALMASGLGLEATGVDTAPSAIAIAEGKAQDRGLTARFLVWNALQLADLGEDFDTVIDSGLFHVFEDEDRVRFVDSLRAVIPIGGRYYMLCFSDRQPGEFGPRRVTQEEIRASFAEGWQVDSIDPTKMDVTFRPEGVFAWLSTITRTRATDRLPRVVDWRLELVQVPVSDVDRAKAFYTEKVGFNADHDHKVSDEIRFVQLTPPGSACSIALGTGLSKMPPGSVQGLQLVVSDIHAARAELAERGVDVSEVQEFPWGSFVFFSDPDGNSWAVQAIPPRG